MSPDGAGAYPALLLAGEEKAEGEGVTDTELDRLADRMVEKMDARGASVAPRLMNIAITARYIGRTESAVEHMVHRGIIPATRLDGKVQIDRLLLDQLIVAKTI